MMSKEMDEKIRSFSTDKANAAIATAASAGLGASTATAAISATDPFDNECPLQLWKAIVYTLTSKSSGNLRIDQGTVALNLATVSQRQSESINDFQQRLENIANTFSILQLDPPSKATEAMRSIQGLENSRFSSMQTHFANGLNMNDALDLCPVDLHFAAAQASK